VILSNRRTTACVLSPGAVQAASPDGEDAVDAATTGDDDPTIVRLDEPTPAGGAYAVLTYLDDDGQASPRSRGPGCASRNTTMPGTQLLVRVGAI
jgi:hypothetical protein